MPGIRALIHLFHRHSPLTMSLANPLNALLLPPILYLLYLIVFPTHDKSPKKLPDTYAEDEYNWLPAKHPEVLCYRRYGPKELSQYNGVDGGRILLAIMRVGRNGKLAENGKGERTVFDVSNGRQFYGPGEFFNMLHRLILLSSCPILTLQTACMATLLAETHHVVWPNSRSTRVSGLIGFVMGLRLISRNAYRRGQAIRLAQRFDSVRNVSGPMQEVVLY